MIGVRFTSSFVDWRHLFKNAIPTSTSLFNHLSSKNKLNKSDIQLLSGYKEVLDASKTPVQDPLLLLTNPSDQHFLHEKIMEFMLYLNLVLSKEDALAVRQERAMYSLL